MNNGGQLSGGTAGILDFEWLIATDEPTPHTNSNALREFFDSRKQGQGIWKWNHYFDIYDRHFRRFRGQEVHVLEIGVYSGGSLEMWREYFGPKARIFGVDIEPDCRVYESDNIKIFIGDQADRLFWRDFRQQVTTLDIVIDDGGHLAEQQIVSVEELLPFLRAWRCLFLRRCPLGVQSVCLICSRLGPPTERLFFVGRIQRTMSGDLFVIPRHFSRRWALFISTLL